MISKVLDKHNIVNVQITAFTSIAENVGSNRILFGGDFTSPVGNPNLPPERERVYRERLVKRALDMLSTLVEGPTIVRFQED